MQASQYNLGSVAATTRPVHHRNGNLSIEKTSSGGNLSKWAQPSQTQVQRRNNSEVVIQVQNEESKDVEPNTFPQSQGQEIGRQGKSNSLSSGSMSEDSAIEDSIADTEEYKESNSDHQQFTVFKTSKRVPSHALSFSGSFCDSESHSRVDKKKLIRIKTVDVEEVPLNGDRRDSNVTSSSIMKNLMALPLFGGNRSSRDDTVNSQQSPITINQTANFGSIDDGSQIEEDDRNSLSSQTRKLGMFPSSIGSEDLGRVAGGIKLISNIRKIQSSNEASVLNRLALTTYGGTVNSQQLLNTAAYLVQPSESQFPRNLPSSDHIETQSGAIVQSACRRRENDLVAPREELPRIDSLADLAAALTAKSRSSSTNTMTINGTEYAIDPQILAGSFNRRTASIAVQTEQPAQQSHEAPMRIPMPLQHTPNVQDDSTPPSINITQGERSHKDSQGSSDPLPRLFKSASFVGSPNFSQIFSSYAEQQRKDGYDRRQTFDIMSQSPTMNSGDNLSQTIQKNPSGNFYDLISLKADSNVMQLVQDNRSQLNSQWSNSFKLTGSSKDDGKQAVVQSAVSQKGNLSPLTQKVDPNIDVAPLQEAAPEVIKTTSPQTREAKAKVQEKLKDDTDANGQTEQDSFERAFFADVSSETEVKEKSETQEEDQQDEFEKAFFAEASTPPQVAAQRSSNNKQVPSPKTEKTPLTSNLSESSKALAEKDPAPIDVTTADGPTGQDAFEMAFFADESPEPEVKEKSETHEDQDDFEKAFFAGPTKLEDEDPYSISFFGQEAPEGDSSKALIAGLPPVPKGAALCPFSKIVLSHEEKAGLLPSVPKPSTANPYANLKATQSTSPPEWQKKDKTDANANKKVPAMAKQNPFEISLQTVKTPDRVQGKDVLKLNNQGKQAAASKLPPVPAKASLNPYLALALTSPKNSETGSVKIKINSSPLTFSSSEKSFEDNSINRRLGVTFAPQIETKSTQSEKGKGKVQASPKSCLRANSFTNLSSSISKRQSQATLQDASPSCQVLSSQKENVSMVEEEKKTYVLLSSKHSTQNTRVKKKRKTDRSLQKSKSSDDQEMSAAALKLSGLVYESPTKALHIIAEESDPGSMASSEVDSQDGSGEKKVLAFSKGMLRNSSVNLSYLPRCQPQLRASKSQTTGNSATDFVVNQACGLGLDPEIFLKVNNMLSGSQSSASSEYGPLSAQSSSFRSSPSEKSGLTPPEVIEVANLLVLANEQRSVSIRIRQQEAGHQKSLSSRFLYGQASSSQQQVSASVGGLRTREDAKETRLDLRRDKGSDNPILNAIIKDNMSLREETLKTRLQLSILSFYLKRQKCEDDKKIETLNNSIRILKSHELKLSEITMRQQSKQQKLHFAFCFASPLVISGKNCQKNIYKLMPPLNFQKEFLKIQHSVEEAKVKLRMTKRQCTTNILNEILAKNPYGIHFSGHGLLNNEQELGPDLFKMYKGEGNFLLLETEDGSGNLVSTDTLTQMIQKNYTSNSLQLVVVATCHSEFVGEIFQEAGAKHVICIHQEYEVEDDAVITFTDSFYGLLFDQKTICDAFEQAKLQVLLTHSEQQASIFKLLKHEDASTYHHQHKSLRQSSLSSKKKRQYASYGSYSTQSTKKFPSVTKRESQVHFCSIFGPFEKGKMQFWDPVCPQLMCRAPLQPTLIGRAVDKFKLVQNILNNKASRLFTLTGMPGVGKSSLVLSTLEWMGERSLLRGGAIYFNARDINCSVIFTRKLCNQLARDNPKLLVQNFTSSVDCHKEPMQALKLIISKLSRIEDSILLVVDNCEDLIKNDNKNFRKLVSYFLQRVNSMKILLTSRVLLHAGFKEQSIHLGGLNEKQSASLFLANTRVISQDERNRLMDLVPDYEMFPNERCKPKPRHISEHHLFTLLNGNPQSIILTAPVLSDQERCIDLPELYRVLTSDKICHLLKGVDIENRMLASLRMSAQVSVQHIFDTNCESLDLFFLLGLLPGGITSTDLNSIWIRVMAKLRGKHDRDYQDGASSKYSKSKSKILFKGSLLNAYNELLRGKIVEQRREENSSNDTIVSGTLEISKAKDLIEMPEFIRKIAEGLIDNEVYESLDKIIAHWLQKIAKKEYCSVGNLNNGEEPAMKVAEAESFDKNFAAFVARMLSNCQNDSKTNTGNHDDATPDMNHTSLIDNVDKAFDDYSEQNQSDNESDNEEDKSICNNSFLDKILTNEQSKKNNDSANQKPLYSVNSRVSVRRRKTVDRKDQNESWTELDEAHDKVEMKSKVNMASLGTSMIALVDMQMKLSAKEIVAENPEKQAWLRWRQLFNLATKKLNMKENMALGGLKSLGGVQIESEHDSSNYSFSEYNSPVKLSKHGSMASAGGEDLMNMSQFSQDQEQNPATVNNSMEQPTIGNLREKFGEALQNRFKDTFDQLNQIKRGALRKQMTITPTRLASQSNFTTATNVRHTDRLNSDETIILYLLASKMCAEDQRSVLQLITKSLIQMHKTSKLFKGNVRRFQAHCLLQEFVKEQCPNTGQGETERNLLAVKEGKRAFQELEIEDCLIRALQSFELEECTWGQGLVYFQWALFISQKIKAQKSIAEKPNKSLEHFRKQIDQGKTINQSQVNNMVKDNQLKQELKTLLDHFFELAGKAIVAFESLNHWRGLVQAYKLVDSVAQEHKIGAEQLANYSQRITEREVVSATNSDRRNAAPSRGNPNIKNLFLDLKGQTAKFAGYYRQACLEQTDLTKMLSIPRKKGEVFSLMIEIVHYQKIKELFVRRESSATLAIPSMTKTITVTPSSSRQYQKKGTLRKNLRQSQVKSTTNLKSMYPSLRQSAELSNERAQALGFFTEIQKDFIEEEDSSQSAMHYTKQSNHSKAISVCELSSSSEGDSFGTGSSEEYTPSSDQKVQTRRHRFVSDDYNNIQ